jgi:flagella basal body P-ring formation protein FlgA
MNPRRLTMRKKVQLIAVALALAFATQLLLRQWGYGAELPPDDPPAAAPAPAIAGGEQDHFVPDPNQASLGATLELRSEATVYGADVKVRQVCRWADADAAACAPIADLVLVHMKGAVPFQSISLDELRQTLHDAGVNVAMIRFAGPTSCTVTRSDVKFDEQTALQQWIAAKEGKVASTDTQPAGQGAVASAIGKPPLGGTAAVGLTALEATGASAAAVTSKPITLADLLTQDLAVRLSVPVDQLQVNFDPEEQSLINLAEPQFKFNIQPRHIFGLGDVSWQVTVVSDSGNQKANVSATARAWQEQLSLVRPLAPKEVIQASDLIQKRILVDHLPDEPLLTGDEAIGQQASRELKPGDLLTSHMVEPVPLAKVGQIITVDLDQGTIHIKTVARALETGSYGQSIRAKNEATGDMYEITLTGPQEGTIGAAPTQGTIHIASTN